MKNALVIALKTVKVGRVYILGLHFMVMFSIVILSILSYQGPVHYLKGSKIGLFYVYATAKNKIYVCSNKYENISFIR